MKFWSDADPRATKRSLGLACFGLVTLTAMTACPVQAEEATASPAAAPATTSAKPVKLKAKPASAQWTPECVRTGQRVIAALARDDSGAASQFHNFYIAFKCSPQHLAQAFGCLVNLQAATPGLSNPSPEQVTQCWEDPTVLPKVQPPPSPEAAGEKK